MMDEFIKPTGESELSAEIGWSEMAGNVAAGAEQAGLHPRIMPIEGNVEYPEAIVMERADSDEGEARVRVYRGLNSPAHAFTQSPYAMRVRSSEGGTNVISDVLPEVTALAAHPTYDTFEQYIAKMRPVIPEKERARFNQEVTEVEEAVLAGHTIREELLWAQIGHNGGVSDSGISPYVSASVDPRQAVAYARGALLAIDAPLSSVEYSGESEVRICGMIKPDWVSAVILRNDSSPHSETETTGLEDALSAVDSVVSPLSPQKSVEAELLNQYTARNEQDRLQWSTDVVQIRQKRLASLREQFPEVAIQTDTAPSDDIYSRGMRQVFDHYAGLLNRLGRNGYDLVGREYQEVLYGERKPFNRDAVTPAMLVQLRELTLRIQAREAGR